MVNNGSTSRPGRLERIGTWVGLIGGLLAILAFLGYERLSDMWADPPPGSVPITRPAVAAPPPALVEGTDRDEDPPSTTRARPSTSVPAGFVGTWRGSVEQHGDPNSPYPVVVDISDGSLGEIIATAEYPSLDCTVHWILNRAGSTDLVVREVVDSGNCVDVTISLDQHGTDLVDYAFDTPSVGRATLERAA